MDQQQLETIAARTAHEANRVYCESLGDFSQPHWDDAPDWQRESCINGVQLIVAMPDTTPQQSHANWMEQKEADGWIWGKEKGPEAKTHPCMVPYDELPPEQKLKDSLFGAVVRSVLKG